MIEEKEYGISKVMLPDSHWESYAKAVNIDAFLMDELKDYFVGFAELPIGVYDHKSFEIAAYKFASPSELKQYVQDKHADGVQMILYYIFDERGNNILRMAEL